MATSLRPFPQAALRVGSLAAAEEFYCHRLGFRRVAGRAHPGVARVEGPRGVLLLLAAPGADLSPWPGVRQPGAGAWIYLQRPDLPTLAEELAARGLTCAGLREPHPGYRDLHLTDPDGYVLVFWEPLPVDDAAVVENYRAGPRRLAAALAGLTENDLDLPWAPGKWTIRQIVHHLTDADLSTFQVLRLALALPGHQIQPNVWDPDDFAAGLRYDQLPVAPSVALLTTARTWVLGVMANLPDALDREACWPSGHRAQVRTLLRQVGAHALHHIGQIVATRRQFER